MKELFQKLSNLFNFGKEARLVNEGEETQKPAPEAVQEGQKPEPILPKTSEEVAQQEKAKAEEAVKPADANLTKLQPPVNPQEADAGGDVEMEPMDVMKEGARAEKAEASLMAKPGMKELFDTMNETFGTDPSKEAIAAGMTGKPQPEGKEMEFTNAEVAKMMEEAEAEEGKPDEALMAAANKAGVEAEATGELAKGFDLSEEGGKEIAFNEEGVEEGLGEEFEPMDLSEEGVADTRIDRKIDKKMKGKIDKK